MFQSISFCASAFILVHICSCFRPYISPCCNPYFSMFQPIFLYVSAHISCCSVHMSPCFSPHLSMLQLISLHVSVQISPCFNLYLSMFQPMSLHVSTPISPCFSWYLMQAAHISPCFNPCLSMFQLISDAGFQGEITSVSTACHQIEVFSKVLRTSITGFLEGGEDTIEKNLHEFTVS